MPNTNSSFSPITRVTQFHALLEKLEALSHRQANDQELDQFDDEIEEVLGRHFGPTNARLEAYKYATLAEAETLVNLPESAQEPSAQDLPKKAIQQRRQVLEGIISELQAVEGKEKEALTGEDREDPPMG
ncbi:MAG: hypothetical protein H0W13_11745 [Nitrospirales bacterium]|nr:hypothetical protein [Nitrospirales bacterium]